MNGFESFLNSNGCITDGIWIFFFSAVAWQLTLTTPTKSTESGKVLESHEDRDKLEGSLYILLFKSLIDSDSAVSSQLLLPSMMLSHLRVAYALFYLL